MDIAEIEQLMAAMNRAGISRLAIKREGFEIELEKRGVRVVAESQVPEAQEVEQSPAVEPKREAKGAIKEEGRFVLSPMVGTFYLAPSPKDPPFVKVGDSLSEGQTVCIIEAMKVMNEVKAAVSGKVVEILVKNGQPVEFGMKLIRVV